MVTGLATALGIGAKIPLEGGGRVGPSLGERWEIKHLVGKV